MTATGRGSVAERLQVSPEVASALAGGRPVVALESTLISHGFDYPANLDVARASESAVRESGAVNAVLRALLQTMPGRPAGQVTEAPPLLTLVIQRSPDTAGV